MFLFQFNSILYICSSLAKKQFLNIILFFFFFIFQFSEREFSLVNKTDFPFHIKRIKLLHRIYLSAILDRIEHEVFLDIFNIKMPNQFFKFPSAPMIEKRQSTHELNNISGHLFIYTEKSFIEFIGCELDYNSILHSLTM